MSKEQSQYFANTTAQQSDSTMNLILNPEDLLREIEIFLKGYHVKVTFDKETNTEIYEKIIVGEAKANDNGVNSLMMWLKTKISPLISMGNISTEQYSDFLLRTRTSLARNLMINRINYGMSLASYTEVCDTFMECFEPFFTSSIRGGHRNAITKNTTIESKELIEQDKRKRFGVI